MALAACEPAAVQVAPTPSAAQTDHGKAADSAVAAFLDVCLRPPLDEQLAQRSFERHGLTFVEGAGHRWIDHRDAFPSGAYTRNGSRCSVLFRGDYARSVASVVAARLGGSILPGHQMDLPSGIVPAQEAELLVAWDVPGPSFAFIGVSSEYIRTVGRLTKMQIERFPQ